MSLAAGVVAGFTQAVMSIAGKLVTRKFFEKVLTILVVKGLTRLAEQSSNKLDDQVVAEIVERLTDGD